jgi:hypothetical protein
VGQEIVEDEVDFLALILLDEAVHEVAALQTAASVVLADDLPGADVECAEQGRGAVPLVVIRLARYGLAIWQLQVSLSPLQRLDRWFFIDRKHHRIGRRAM